MQRLIQKQKEKPQTLIQASAVGIYGTSLEKTFTEDSATSDEDFLSHTAHLWEKEGQHIEAMGIRTVYARFGVMLGEKGALPLMILPYKFLVTAERSEREGSGCHGFMSRMRYQMIRYAVENAGISGSMNVTAPNPVDMKQFGKTIARVKHRPHWLPVPEFFLSKALGEMSLLIVKGQRALPKKAITSGFRFTYSDLEFALSQLIADRKTV
nr:DUF1731 domain-containing protein [Bacillus subtilis]